MRNIILSILAASMLAGCVTNQTGGALVGGASGAAIGSMFGGGTGRLVGTGVGAVIGTMVGSSVGASMDRENRVVYTHPTTYSSAGEAAAYNRGRAEREEQIQSMREQRAYERGLRGY